MDEPNHYSFLRPRTGSKYAFLFRAVQILDAEPSPAPWHVPMPIADEMSNRIKDYHRRWNVMLDVHSRTLRARASDLLLDAGFPRAKLKEPRSPEVDSLIVELVVGMRASLALHFGDPAKQQASKSGKQLDRDICTRIVSSVHHCLSSHAKTALYLNEGLPAGQRGLSRHHIMRACEAETARWIREGFHLDHRTSMILIGADRERIAALCIVFNEAKKRKEFRLMAGASLAEAIHGTYDLSERVCRAERAVSQAA